MVDDETWKQKQILISLVQLPMEIFLAMKGARKGHSKCLHIKE